MDHKPVKIGTLYGVSVGTGDPELLTVKGLRLLQQTKVVAFPAGVGQKVGRAEQIIAPWLQPQQQKLALSFPYLQDNQILAQAWEKSAFQVWDYLSLGEDVVFACLGDIGLYSTFTYLAQTLTNLHPEIVVKTIPGVTSPLAAAAELGIPLTVLDQRLAILPALYTVAELEQVLAWADVVVLLKVSSVYPQVWEFLKQNNLLKQAWIVENATLSNQILYHNLAPDLKLSYFSVLIIKK